MVAGLEGRWVLVLVRTVEECGWFVLVFPDAPLEVLSCGTVVSTHLGESGHGTSVDVLEHQETRILYI